MWSQSANIFDPYVALMDASKKNDSSNGQKTAKDEE